MMVYSRRFLLVVCILQFIATIEWQVFNFLGYMWSPILACFVHFIFLLIGFFGALQYRPRCAIVYLLWLILWIGINVFIICIYLEIGMLKKDSLILNFGLGNKSWWFDHGIGCIVNTTSSAYSSVRSPTDSALGDVQVTNCLLHYTFVEIIHAGVQILLAFLGLLAAICLAYVLRNDEDSSQPVKTSELEFISMRQSMKGPLPHQPLSAGRRANGGTPPVAAASAAEFDTLVTQVDTLSPHHSRNASHESLQPMPPQRLSANRLLREAHLRPRNDGDDADDDDEEEDEEEEREALGALSSSAARRRQQRPQPPGSSLGGSSAGGASRRHRRHHGHRATSSVPASSYAGADSSLDQRSVFSRDSQRPREPLPWVVAAPLLSDLGAPADQQAQPPPYSSQPPSMLSGYRSGPPYQREPPSPAPYRPPRPAGAHSPYENWRPLTTPAVAATDDGMGTYENAWSPVPPLQPMMTSPISAEDAASSNWPATSRSGVIFFRSNNTAGTPASEDNAADPGGGGLSFGGSVVV